MESAASQCITAASVLEDCKKLLPDFPIAAIEKMQQGDGFAYITCLSMPAIADRLIAAKVCHQQLIPLSNSLETRSDDAVELRRRVEEAAMVISKQTPAALRVIGDVIADGLDGSASKSDLQMQLLSQLVAPTTFKSFCKVAQTFQASGRIISHPKPKTLSLKPYTLHLKP